MTKSNLIRNCAGAVLMAFVVGNTVLALPQAQSPSGSPSTQKVEKPLVPLKVQVTLSRYDGEKKTSNLPFTLWVNANDANPTNLNVAMQVPVPDSNVPPNIQYRSLGTNIACGASALDDSRFRLDLTISDTSLIPSKDKNGLPSISQLSTRNYLLLKDGQTAQFLAATDKVTGEVTKVDVTVSVLK